MTRRYNASETTRKARSKRQYALDRVELRAPSTPRIPASGPISAPLKARNDSDDALVRDFLARREADK